MADALIHPSSYHTRHPGEKLVVEEPGRLIISRSTPWKKDVPSPLETKKRTAKLRNA